MNPAISAAARLDPASSQQAFRALLSAVARPGSIVPHRLPHPEIPPALLVPLALGDVNTTFHVVGVEPWARLVGEATGAAASPLPDADLVAMPGPVVPLDFGRLRTGDDIRPEAGAKVGISCGLDASEGGPQAVTLRLTGPGIAGVERLEVRGHPPQVFDTLAGVNSDFPRGVDVWLISGHWVAAIPRSVSMVVEHDDSRGDG